MPQQIPKPENPRLQQAIEAFRQEHSQQRLAAIMLALPQAALLVPAVIDPGSRPALNRPDGRMALPGDTRIRFTRLNDPQGGRYFIAFTDEAVFKSIRQAQNMPTNQSALLLRFDGIASLFRQDGQAAGLIIDPFTGGVRIPRAAIEALVAAGSPIRPGEDLTIVEPSVFPDELLDPLCAVLAGADGIEAAYLQLAIPKNGRRSYLLILQGTVDRPLLDKLAAAARPYLSQNPQKLGLTITPAASPLGQQGIQDSEPFYRHGVGRTETPDEEDQP